MMAINERITIIATQMTAWKRVIKRSYRKIQKEAAGARYQTTPERFTNNRETNDLKGEIRFCEAKSGHVSSLHFYDLLFRR